MTEELRLNRFLPCLRGENEDLWVRGSEWWDTTMVPPPPVAATSEGEFGEKDEDLDEWGILNVGCSCNSTSDLSTDA